MFLLPIAVVVGWLVLHWGNIHAIMCKCIGVSEQILGQSNLQIVCTYRWKNYLVHVSDSLGKKKRILANNLVSN